MPKDYNPVFDRQALTERIINQPRTETKALPARQRILQNALRSFDSLLAKLPETERDAATSVLHAQIIDTLFDLHRFLESIRARRGGRGTTSAERQQQLCKYRVVIDELSRVYEAD